MWARFVSWLKSCYCLIVLLVFKKYWQGNFSFYFNLKRAIIYILIWGFKGVILNVTLLLCLELWAAEFEISFMRLGWEILCHDMCFLSDSSMLAWLLKLEYIAIILCFWLRMVVMVMVVSTCLHIYLLYVSTWMISLWMWISEVIRGLKYY